MKLSDTGASALKPLLKKNAINWRIPEIYSLERTDVHAGAHQKYELLRGQPASIHTRIE
jgi:hypothetical protein